MWALHQPRGRGRHWHAQYAVFGRPGDRCTMGAEVTLPGGGYVFAGEVDLGCVGPMFVAMIVFCWFLDLFFSTIEESVEGSPANRAMVRKAYKEMMLLGVLMFIFIMLKDFRAFAPTQSFTHCFDFSLLMVTFTIFLYVGNTAVSSFSMHVCKRSWDRMAMMTVHDIVKRLKQNLPPDDPTCAQRLSLWLEDFVKNTMGIGKHWRLEADFKVVEMLFKTKFYLDRTFNYNRYLELVLEDTVVNLSNLSPYHWLAVIVLCVTAEQTIDAGEVALEQELMQNEEDELLATDSGRRRLGAASGEGENGCKFTSEVPVVPMPCGMSQTAIDERTASLFEANTLLVEEVQSGLGGDLMLNLTNTTSSYEFFCKKCERIQQLQQQEPLSDSAIWTYIFCGWVLLLIELVLLFFLRHRNYLIYRYHGAGRPSNIPVLLSKLDKHFKRNELRGKKRVDGHLVSEETVIVHHPHDGTDSDDDEEHAPPIAHTPAQPPAPVARADDVLPSPSMSHIDAATSPESSRYLANFLDGDVTNSPAGPPKPEKKKENKNKEEGEGTAENGGARKGVEMEMMHFSNAGKNANDILSYRLYVFLCSVTKMVMLLSCLYVAFYWAHYSLRINQKLMRQNADEYGIGGEIEPTPWGTDGSADQCNLIVACFYDALFYHFMALLPMFFLVVMVLPKVTRRISLLVGVLHLHDNALQETVSHMETIESVRTRIMERLETTTVTKGKPKLQKARDLLARLQTGEVALLHKLATISDEHHEKVIEISHKKEEHRERWSGVDWDHSPPPAALEAVLRIQRAYLRYQLLKQMANHTLGVSHVPKQLGTSRVTRKQAMEMLEAQETQTDVAELVKFLSREAFQDYTERSPARKQTAQTAKSLRISKTSPDDDSILVKEFGTFLTRAIAEVVNVAGECGATWDEIKTFEEEVLNFGAITHNEFVQARRTARSKSLFYHMSHGAEEVTHKQLRKGLKRYRVPISKQEFNFIIPVMDPDQTKSITLEEWLDFAMSTDDSLVQQVLNSEQRRREANAMKGGSQGGLVGMAFDTVQYSREAIGAVPLGAVLLSTIEHPVETGRKAVTGVQELAEMEAKDALAVVAGIDKQRKKIAHEFQPLVEGAFEDVASLGLHAVEAGVGVVTGAAELAVDVVEGAVDAVEGAIEEVEAGVGAGVDFIRGSPQGTAPGGAKSPRSPTNGSDDV